MPYHPIALRGTYIFALLVSPDIKGNKQPMSVTRVRVECVACDSHSRRSPMRLQTMLVQKSSREGLLASICGSQYPQQFVLPQSL